MISDEKLIANYLSGDEKSLETIIKRYLRLIFSFSCRYVGDHREAEDITQTVFVRVWRNLNKFDQKKKFRTWVFGIAKNACIDSLRKKKELPFAIFENGMEEISFEDKIADKAALPDEIFARKDACQKLQAALDSLPVNLRTLLFLRYNDHFTFREIAESLEEPLNTVKSRHGRALLRLRKLLTQ